METLPVHIPGEISAGDDLAGMILDGMRLDGMRLEEGDVLVVAQKAVSKAEGRTVSLEGVECSPLARGIAGEYGKDPRVVELVLREAAGIVRMERGIIVTRLPSGHICANSGVDTSNVPAGCALLLPADCDASAERMASAIFARTGVRAGVVVSDTVGRPFRNGQTDIALGCARIRPLLDHTGKADTHGRIMRVSVTAVADQLAGAAELVMGKVSGTPAAVLRGSGASAGNGSGQDVIRSGGELFV